MKVGEDKEAKDLKVPFLGKIPMYPEICEDSDKEMPFIVEHTNSPAAKAFMEIVKKEGFLRYKEEVQVRALKNPRE